MMDRLPVETTWVADSLVTDLEDLINANISPDTASVTRMPPPDGYSGDILDFFNLNSNPFGDSLDTSLLYWNRKLYIALLKMLETVKHDISFGLIIGKSGIGKSILSQAILEKLPVSKYKTLLISVTPGLSRTGFLSLVLKQLGIKTNNNIRVHEAVELVGTNILNLHESGIKLVLIIDECHFLSAHALHLLRTLSNFEAYNRKILTCLLFSEPHFLTRLKNPSYQSLKSRIYLEEELTPLSLGESKEYIDFRLKKAGYKGREIFSEFDLKEIHEISHGIPRLLNKECLNRLINRFYEHSVRAQQLGAGAYVNKPYIKREAGTGCEERT